MSELKREDFIDTKWNACDWTEEQKIKWQEKCFELGFSWQGKTKVLGLNCNFFWMGDNNHLYFDNNDYEFFLEEDSVEKQFSDMFPEKNPVQPEMKPEIDVIQEIVDMVESRKGEVEESEEDEHGFEGLVYVEPENDMSYLVLDKLSEEQKMFIQQNLKCDECIVTTKYPKLSISCGEYYTGFGFTDDTSLEISFNDIFKYKENFTMRNIQLTTNDNIRFEKVGEVVQVSGLIGGYRKVGNQDEFFYYTNLIEISEVQKSEFEGRVREIIRNVERLEESV